MSTRAEHSKTVSNRPTRTVRVVRWLVPALGHQVGDTTTETDQRADHLTACGLAEDVKGEATEPDQVEEVEP